MIAGGFRRGIALAVAAGIFANGGLHGYTCAKRTAIETEKAPGPDQIGRFPLAFGTSAGVSSRRPSGPIEWLFPSKTDVFGTPSISLQPVLTSSVPLQKRAFLVDGAAKKKAASLMDAT